MINIISHYYMLLLQLLLLFVLCICLFAIVFGFVLVLVLVSFQLSALSTFTLCILCNLVLKPYFHSINISLSYPILRSCLSVRCLWLFSWKVSCFLPGRCRWHDLAQAISAFSIMAVKYLVSSNEYRVTSKNISQ